VANAEARTLAHNLAFPGDLRPYPHDWVPSAVFSEPQIATVGARAQDLGSGRRYVEAIQLSEVVENALLKLG
jgi:mycothione reductase